MGDKNETNIGVHEAAREGRAELLESLLKAAPELASRRDSDDRLPIHWAVSNNHLSAIEVLLSQRGFDPDVQDGSGWTPLMMASSLSEGDQTLDLLLHKEADVTMTNFNGQTALHFAASKNNVDTARKLINAKASTRVKDRRGQIPLHRAAANGSVPMISLLLKHNSPLNATDISGYTALHHAICEGHGVSALTLLKAGAETEKRDEDGFLAIELAPDAKVRNFILQSVKREEIELS